MRKREVVFFFVFPDLTSGNNLSSEMPARMFSQNILCEKAVSLYSSEIKQNLAEILKCELGCGFFY